MQPLQLLAQNCTNKVVYLKKEIETAAKQVLLC